jgi:predicted DNA binding CopG/RHH family protein
MRKDKNFVFRVSEEEINTIKNKAEKFGYHSVCDFIRQVLLNVEDVQIKVISKNDQNN